MSIETVRYFLLWCAVINYGILLLWFLVFTFAHDWVSRVHGFRLSGEQFNAINYACIILFKIAIILFNLVPCIALYIVG
jgi:hypothetical protein